MKTFFGIHEYQFLQWAQVILLLIIAARALWPARSGVGRTPPSVATPTGEGTCRTGAAASTPSEARLLREIRSLREMLEGQ